MKKFVTLANLHQREGASTDDNSMQVIPKGKTVEWTGYSFITANTEWKLVKYAGKLGFCSSKYLKAV